MSYHTRRSQPLLAKLLCNIHNGSMHVSSALYGLSEVDQEDQSLVGQTGSMLGSLKRSGFPILDGFIISSSAFHSFLKENNLITKITHLLQTVNYTDPHSLLQVSSHIQTMIRKGKLSETLVTDIFGLYERLGDGLSNPTVSIRSSMTTSYTYVPLAGERSTVDIVQGESSLVSAILTSWASLFDARSLHYRHEKQYDAFRIQLSLVIQKVLPAAISGSYFSVDPATHQKDTCVIEAIYGIQDVETKQHIPPDSYTVQKTTAEILSCTVRDQTMARERVGSTVHTVRVAADKVHTRKLSEHMLSEIVTLGKKLEERFYFPFEASFAYVNTTLYLVNVKPLTLHPITHEESQAVSNLDSGNLRGTTHTQGIATGHVRFLDDEKSLASIVSGEIVILPILDETRLPKLKRAYGIISEKTVMSPSLIQQIKTLGKPCVSGVPHLRNRFKDGSVITVNANTGEILSGGTLLTESHKKQQLTEQPQKIATKLYLSIIMPHTIEKAAMLSADGIGLLDGNSLLRVIGSHPKKVIKESRQKEHAESLSSHLETICRDFYPRPVLYRASDLLSDELRKLEGGHAYEPGEHNPLLGYHGGSRLMHDPASFHLELNAIQKVRVMKELSNLQLILPYIRSPHELDRIKKVIQTHSFSKSPNFKLWMSVDTPENAVLIDTYLAHGVKGLIINVTSLASLFLGVDPKNSEVASLFDEENGAVIQAVQYVVRRAHKHQVPVLLYSNSIDHLHTLLAEAVNLGISGIITPPDGLENMRKTLYKYERKLLK